MLSRRRVLSLYRLKLASTAYSGEENLGIGVSITSYGLQQLTIATQKGVNVVINRKFMESKKNFPLTANDYELYEEIGEGACATVYRALCIPLNETVAIKVLDFEKCDNDLDGIGQQVQTRILIDHPNVLRAYCSFTTGHNLWVVMPFMAGGSCLHILKTSFPKGFEEAVIATLLREVLKALVYFHAHRHIHRDVKAGNILIDSDGSVKLGDFGIAACMFDTSDRQPSRNTFVGTQCWMAPEVMLQQVRGYDFKADIWSFGITALELAHGHAPFSKYPPMKVLLTTLQNDPPGLDYEREKRFSKSFREMIASCLVKDPEKRLTSEKLLKLPFFKNARSSDYLSHTILDSLSRLGESFRTLKAKEKDILVQDKELCKDKEHLSQQEYIRGISAWNFNLEDLKNRVAHVSLLSIVQLRNVSDFINARFISSYSQIQDDLISNSEDSSVSGKQIDAQDDIGFTMNRVYPERVNHFNAASQLEDELNDINDLDPSVASFPSKPLQALKDNKCMDLMRIAKSLEADNQISYDRERPSKHRRCVPLRCNNLFQRLVDIYSRLFLIHYPEFKLIVEAHSGQPNISSVNGAKSAATALVSAWFWDLYVSLRKSVQSVSGSAFTQHFGTPQSFILERYDRFLVHLNAILRPTHIQYTIADAVYIPLITTTYDWNNLQNPFTITDMKVDEDYAYALMEIMEKRNSSWRIEKLSSDIFGTPAWLLDWHPANENVITLKPPAAYAWFPDKSNFNKEDLIAAYIIGEAITPILGPVDADDWQLLLPDGRKPADVFWAETHRVDARRFTGSTEVRVYDEKKFDFIVIRTTRTSGSKRPAPDIAGYILPQLKETVSEASSLEKVDMFRILDYCYYARVIFRTSAQSQHVALKAMAFI
ncbi:protein kinase [Striga asiatica]|uniref:Protein kinase n=1 Tax=Striga asiatica TaxID=4170 RepID=A0A5A7PG32_STRAF|nr:protein kinase [Striga asiatica]